MFGSRRRRPPKAVRYSGLNMSCFLSILSETGRLQCLLRYFVLHTMHAVPLSRPSAKTREASLASAKQKAQKSSELGNYPDSALSQMPLASMTFAGGNDDNTYKPEPSRLERMETFVSSADFSSSSFTAADHGHRQPQRLDCSRSCFHVCLWPEPE